MSLRFYKLELLHIFVIIAHSYSQSQECVPDLVSKLNLDAVVADFSPLRVPLSWITNVKKELPDDVPFCQVNTSSLI